MGFHPYLYFDGDCAAAFEHYQEVFDGEALVMKGTDAPPDAGIPPDRVDRVMHVSLMTADGELLMGSDSFDDSFSPMAGSFVHYATDDLERGKAVLAGVSEGGEVLVEGRSEFWTPFWGAAVDRFGIRWQVSVEGEPPA